jgi:hypothetical protein
MDEEERGELISRMFAMMTAELEDAAGWAAEGQGIRRSNEVRLQLAERISSAVQKVDVIATATTTILESRSQEPL